MQILINQRFNIQSIFSSFLTSQCNQQIGTNSYLNMAAAADRKHEALSDDQGISVSVEDQEVNEDMPDVHDAAMKIERAKGAYMVYSGLQEKPSKLEIWMWYLYEMCSHFIVTTVVPVVFPLIISEIVSKNDDDDNQGWGQTPRGIACMLREIKL